MHVRNTQTASWEKFWVEYPPYCQLRGSSQFGNNVRLRMKNKSTLFCKLAFLDLLVKFSFNGVAQRSRYLNPAPQYCIKFVYHFFPISRLLLIAKLLLFKNVSPKKTEYSLCDVKNLKFYKECMSSSTLLYNVSGLHLGQV